MNKDNSHDQDLSASIQLKCFNRFVTTAKHLTIESPSLAINLGHYIRHCVQLKTSVSIMQEDEISRKQADDLRHLMEAHWACQVNSDHMTSS